MKRNLIRNTSLASLLFGCFLSFSVLSAETTYTNQANYNVSVVLTSIALTELKQESKTINKPFIQLMEFNPEEIMLATENKKKLGLFEVAMQLQDKVHHYMEVLEKSFTPHSQKNYEPEECRSRGFANIAKFFSF